MIRAFLIGMVSGVCIIDVEQIYQVGVHIGHRKPAAAVSANLAKELYKYLPFARMILQQTLVYKARTCQTLFGGNTATGFGYYFARRGHLKWR